MDSPSAPAAEDHADREQDGDSPEDLDELDEHDALDETDERDEFGDPDESRDLDESDERSAPDTAASPSSDDDDEGIRASQRRAASRSVANHLGIAGSPSHRSCSRRHCQPLRATSMRRIRTPCSRASRTSCAGA